MGLKWWKKWHLSRKFDRLGQNCQFRGACVEIKGHVETGNDCILGNNILFRTHKSGIIRIGNAVELDDYVMLLANSCIEIAEGAYVGPYCVMRDTNHLFHGTDIHWRLTPHITKSILIRAGAYLGARAYVMPGVTIGEGAVIGTASVVTRDVPPMELWAGNPARFIAHRTDLSKRVSLKRDLKAGELFGLDLVLSKSGPE